VSGARVTFLWTPDADALAAQADGVLSADEARRASGFRSDDDRRRYVVAHVWLRRLLGSVLGVAPARVPIEAGPCASCGGPHGKPRLAGGAGVHFSLSHSRDVVLCAIAGAPVGVDVEAIPADDCHSELFTCLHPLERAAVAAAPTSRRPEAFTRCWVRKEAYLKGTGEGLSREPQGIRVGVGERFGDPGPSLDGWRLLDLDAPPGYAAALALPA
jgi:4'-phosphopantetheinyl transferase